MRVLEEHRKQQTGSKSDGDDHGKALDRHNGTDLPDWPFKRLMDLDLIQKKILKMVVPEEKEDLLHGFLDVDAI